MISYHNLWHVLIGYVPLGERRGGDFGEFLFSNFSTLFVHEKKLFKLFKHVEQKLENKKSKKEEETKRQSKKTMYNR